MSWRAITEDDLTASLSAAEIDAYRKSSQFGDPVEAQLRSVAAYVRGVVRSSPARVRLAANPLALPESLIVPAMDYLRFGELLEYDLVPELQPILIEEPGDEEKKRPPRSFQFVELWDEPGLGAEPNLEEASKYVLDKFEINV